MASPQPGTSEPRATKIVVAMALCAVFVVATRLPFARTSAFDSDEVGYLQKIVEGDFPKHHTLFLAAGKLVGYWAHNAYRGFVILDMATSVLALVATWWFLRAIVPPWTAAAATLALGVAPVFWAYGAMAANYTAIVLVGSLLLGIAVRGRIEPKPIYPFAAAVILALGTGYRQDIGLFWLPVFLAILWQYRWIPSLQALMLFVIMNFAWIIPMLRDAGGWAMYRSETSDFALEAGWKNSIWVLGPVDGSLRYAIKVGMALAWTLGLGLLFVPAGVMRLARRSDGPFLFLLVALAAVPALAMHLLVHFGSAGYGFHYLPALVGLMAIGLASRGDIEGKRDRTAAFRGVVVAATLAAIFLCYPTDMGQRGFRGQFDMAYARFSRVGLASPQVIYDTEFWPTANSRTQRADIRPTAIGPRSTILQIHESEG